MRHEIHPSHADFLKLRLLLDLHFLLDGHPLLQPVGEQHLGPQALEGVAPAIPVHPPNLGVETFGESVRDAFIVEVIQDVGLPVPERSSAASSGKLFSHPETVRCCSSSRSR